jgi:cytochrome c oxidase subunit 3
MSSTTYRPPTSGAKNSFASGTPLVAPIDARMRMTAGQIAVASPLASQTGIWVGVCAISMSFAALTSALIVREASGSDWRPFALPSIMYFNTAILLASSCALELASRRMARASEYSGENAAEGNRLGAGAVQWLYLTLALGLIFVAGQYLAWRNLAAQGLFLATSPTSSFFYVLTGFHGVHVLGGVGGLIYVLRRLSRGVPPAGTSALRAASIYWHFMDGLWIYLLLVLRMRM